MSRPPMEALAGSVPADWSECLARIASQGDRDAFSRLFGHFAPRVKGYLMRMGATSEMAEEVTQETMLAVWRKAALYDRAKASAGTWIYTIARNQQIDALRRERRPEIDPDDPALVPNAGPDSVEQIDLVQQGERLRVVLADMPAEQAEVIRLSFFEGKPHGEIAETLGLPLGTVKSRIRLALGRFRAAMEQSP